jgi:hypothetical protein
MRDFAHSPSVPFLASTAAQRLDQMHDRLLSEVRSHKRRTALWEGSTEPCVQLLLAEAELMAQSLNQAAHLLRHISEKEAA